MPKKYSRKKTYPRKSPKRKSPKRKSPKRKSPKRKSLSKPKNIDVSNIEGRCMKCKTNKKMAGAKVVVLKNNRSAAKGNCTVCNTKMFKFV
jgi:hypothetical protein